MLPMTNETAAPGSDHFAWVDNFDEADKTTFLRELLAKLETAGLAGSDGFKQLLHEWQATGETLADPLAREVLLAPRPDDSDWQEREFDLTDEGQEVALRLTLIAQQDDDGFIRFYGDYLLPQINTGLPDGSGWSAVFPLNLSSGWLEVTPDVQVRRVGVRGRRVAVRRRV
jgi:hypothetical protein